MYRIQSLAIFGGLIGLFAIVGFAFFGWTGVFVILLGGVLFNSLTLGSSVRLILSLHRARPIESWEAPGLHRAAHELARRADLPVPQLAIYPSDLPNAFALGRGDGIIAVSTGLLKLLNIREISGVLSHELAHLKNRDSLLNLSAGLFVQAISSLSTVFGILMLLFFLSGSWIGGGENLLPVILLVTFAPYAAAALHAAFMRTRERLADQDAVLLTGDPMGLANALNKLHQYSRYLDRLSRRFRFIYTTDTGAGPKWLRTHPDTDERIDRILELEEKIAPYPGPRVRRIAVT